VSAPSEYAGVFVELRLGSVTVMLDLVQPAVASRWRLVLRRTTGVDKAGERHQLRAFDDAAEKASSRRRWSALCQCRDPLLSASTFMPAGDRGGWSAPAALHVGHGMPASHSQPPGTSADHGRSGCASHTQPTS
jgi:hypothetical protein